MNIRSETLLDYPAIAEVNTLAFGQENEAKLVEEIRRSDHYIGELSMVAEVEGVVVGHILFSYIDLVGAETLQVLGLAPIAVCPQFQRQGIGSKLVQAGLERANVRGEAMVIVLGHPQFYPRFGFKPSVDYEIESPFPVPEDVFMVKPLQNYQEKYKGKVVYPPAFDGV
ncbi:GNAT family N-acetyltransferase [aff. Roholtiella sp. LEGE 12411]|uniref:GNAT family N-acetyltransferase n=1 Tax=aff. Roholtiella sp. LEGE 12411 TaxID=1828822 RepID=UPI001881E51C|nr:N-acetyltransferase [aff. Roholtiella sp. LEGE 12411]MBE9034349.1 N-acetyltransferase [aff. Roholtiella sp. LEGE 12411]